MWNLLLDSGFWSKEMSIFTKLEEEIQAGLKSLEKFFQPGKAQAAIQEAANLINEALPIVQEIDALVGGNKTLERIETIYAKYGEPFLDSAKDISNPNALNNALMNLATSLLQKKLSTTKGPIATSLLNTAIQLAVTSLHAQNSANKPSIKYVS